MMSRSRLTEAVSIFPSDDSFKAILQYFLELGIILFQGQNVIKSSQASRKLCELLEPGLGAIFGPTSPSAANHVQSVSQALHVPFVETRWRLNERDHALRQLEGGSMTWWQQLIASTSTHTLDTWDRLLQTLSKRWNLFVGCNVGSAIVFRLRHYCVTFVTKGWLEEPGHYL